MLYEEIEEQLTALLGCDDTLVLPTITHIHMSVIPLLAASGTIFLDQRAHKTIYDGCQIARARGAAVKRFRFEDPEHLDELLRAERDPTRLVCMDGVNSMTGNAPDLRAFAAVARAHGALLYVDDAHGFGVIGERSPDETCHYGRKGNSVVRHFDETYDNLVLVGGFSKSYSALLAFIACPSDVKTLLKVAAPPYLYSGPSPVASLAAVLKGFDVNASRGDELRRVLCAHTTRVLDKLDELGVHTPNRVGLPDHRDPAERPPAHQRGRALPVQQRRLRDARRLPARAEGRGRLPRPAHRREHRRRGRHAARRDRGTRRARRAAARRRGGNRASGGGGMKLRRPYAWQLYLAARRVRDAALLDGAAVQGQRPGDQRCSDSPAWWR